MNDIIKSFIGSKRFWGFVVAGLVLILKHFGHDLSPAAADAISDQAVLLASAAWNAVTMVIDNLKKK